MVNWDEREENGVCTSEADYYEVQRVCRHINIPCHQVSFVKEYWNTVFRFIILFIYLLIYLLVPFSPMVDGYKRGVTPNPDILCNKRIKFGALHRHIVMTMSVDAIATGHYAQLKRLENGSMHEWVCG